MHTTMICFFDTMASQMEDADHVSDKVSSRSTSSKRGTPNKRWKAEYDNFLIRLLVEQDRQGLKCDISFKRAAFFYVAVHVNSRFYTMFTVENVENHYRTLKMRYAEIKKAKDPSDAGWDNGTKTIMLDLVVAFTYTEVISVFILKFL